MTTTGSSQCSGSARRRPIGWRRNSSRATRGIWPDDGPATGLPARCQRQERWENSVSDENAKESATPRAAAPRPHKVLWKIEDPDSITDEQIMEFIRLTVELNRTPVTRTPTRLLPRDPTDVEI